jgi:hypothetical protein
MKELIVVKRELFKRVQGLLEIEDDKEFAKEVAKFKEEFKNILFLDYDKKLTDFTNELKKLGVELSPKQAMDLMDLFNQPITFTQCVTSLHLKVVLDPLEKRVSKLVKEIARDEDVYVPVKVDFNGFTKAVLELMNNELKDKTRTTVGKLQTIEESVMWLRFSNPLVIRANTPEDFTGRDYFRTLQLNFNPEFVNKGFEDFVTERVKLDEMSTDDIVYFMNATSVFDPRTFVESVKNDLKTKVFWTIVNTETNELEFNKIVIHLLETYSRVNYCFDYLEKRFN